MKATRLHRDIDIQYVDKLMELQSLTREHSLLAIPIKSTLATREKESEIWDAIIRIRRKDDKFVLHRMLAGEVKATIFVGEIEGALHQANEFVEETRARNVKYKDKLPDIPLDYQWVKVIHDKDM